MKYQEWINLQNEKQLVLSTAAQVKKTEGLPQVQGFFLEWGNVLKVTVVTSTQLCEYRRNSHLFTLRKLSGLWDLHFKECPNRGKIIPKWETILTISSSPYNRRTSPVH